MGTSTAFLTYFLFFTPIFSFIFKVHDSNKLWREIHRYIGLACRFSLEKKGQIYCWISRYSTSGRSVLAI